MDLSVVLLVVLSCVLLSNGMEVKDCDLLTENTSFETFQAILPAAEHATEQPYKTAYHFQPLQNWLNGMTKATFTNLVLTTTYSFLISGFHCFSLMGFVFIPLLGIKLYVTIHFSNDGINGVTLTTQILMVSNFI